jgi:hypothetical protein
MLERIPCEFNMHSSNPRVGVVLKTGMYVLSLWLLFLLIFVNKVDVPICFKCKIVSKDELLGIAKLNIMPIICVALLIISMFFQIWFKYLINGAKAGPYQITGVESKGSEHLVFLATYVIPLVGFSLENSRQIINFGITLGIIGAIYVRTNLFYANPTLSLLGFRVYEAIIDGDRVILISKQELDDHDVVNCITLDRKTFFAKKSLRIN